MIKEEMKHILIIIIVVLLFSCNENKKIEEGRIKRFENSLGERETKYLNEITRDFDSYLMTKFKDKKPESEFKQYLTELSESENSDFWKIEEIKLDKYLKSNLFAKYDSIYPDSVWYDGLSFCSNFPHSDFINKMIPLKRKNQELNIDSLINSIKTSFRLYEIEPSYFKIALESIKHEDTLISTYLDSEQMAGSISMRLIAAGLLYNINEDNEYYAKRIMIMEMND